MNTTTSKPRTPRKEAFFVRVQDTDGAPQFFPATNAIGKPMPFSKPQATCAMRTGDEVVAFSLLHVSRRTAVNLAERPVRFPHGPLAKLERVAGTLGELGTDTLVVEVAGERYPMTLTRDENGVVTLETVGEDVSVALERRAMYVDLYLRSPRVDRVLAVGFMGHLGKPETTESVTRLAAMILKSISMLTEFKLLAGIETVNVPAPSARAARIVKVAPLAFTVPLQLFGADMAPAAVGSVHVTVDLENPGTNRLLMHYQPSAELAELFEGYRAGFDLAVNTVLTQVLGMDDVREICFEIVLGEVGQGTVERIADAAKSLHGMDLAPSGQYRTWEVAAQ